MIEIFMLTIYVIGVILGLMWLFLPWLILAKLDKVIEELRKINAEKKHY